ncbi:NADH-quinone oxidoreductase subunit NuoH [Trueperella pyogenes]|uniref:NADH-quinone oxidoreductase subunit NuoH n=1 Tax=Trueperella pyogenes TaxID=1661 RepID=UPI000DFC2298|nr:NADH-quinone oxidoreductase subunit NuoH [Trueperella pyogenes]MBB3025466.1 NADH-quinone oxidoreductase subunit H [Trueperella pyogenes]SUO87814.1 NADH-quinone oxidoreductase subunit H [Trueperella pyogenes]
MNPIFTVGGVAADFSQDTWWIWVIKAIAVVLFLIFSVIFALWFERRLIARMQNRLGPNTVGPLGLGQSFPDAIKLILKEDFWLAGADKVIYAIAPAISALCSFLVMAVIPVGPNVSIFGIYTPIQLADSPVAMLFVLAAAALGEYGMVLGGWSAKSTLPLYGSVRAATQMISYELAQGLSLVTVFITAATMSTSGIVNAQTDLWNVVLLLPAFMIFFVTMFGGTNRLPFDLPEAEGEIVAGPHLEYSSMKFGWYYLAEYVNMLNMSMLATTLFFGGYRSGPILTWIFSLWGGNPNVGWFPVLVFVAKLWIFMAIFVWVRGTLLRFRYDQFMHLGWKGLIPAALGWLTIVMAVVGINMVVRINMVPVLVILGVGYSLILLIWAFGDDTVKKTQQEIIDERESEEFDGFENGYPVPPLPGQHLPPSPRARSRSAANTQTIEEA